MKWLLFLVSLFLGSFQSNAQNTINNTYVNRANQVHIHKKTVVKNYGTPVIPLEKEVVRILNEINPEILVKYKSGKNNLCVIICSYKAGELSKIKAQLNEKRLLLFTPTGEEVLGTYPVLARDCIDDIEQVSRSGYTLQFLENFSRIKL